MEMDTLKLIYTQEEAFELVSEYEKPLKERIEELEKENKSLKEEIRFLEECLDNKEKVNKSLREELQEWLNAM